MARSQTYSDYLMLDQLLHLQRPRSDGPAGPEHDEMLFIVIHQVYELWFKQVLHEVDHLGASLASGDGARALGTLKRVLTILKTMVGQIDILETMTPLDFLSFRHRLESASGFESFQFRELEFALGLKDEKVLERFPPGSEPRERLELRLRQPSIWWRFLEHLRGRGYEVPAASFADASLPTAPSPEVEKVLISVYRTDPGLTQLSERLVDLDEGVQEWRYRHVKMVQRTIGTRRGTGGSAGAEYLQRTLFRPLFPDLWAIRADL